MVKNHVEKSVLKSSRITASRGPHGTNSVFVHDLQLVNSAVIAPKSNSTPTTSAIQNQHPARKIEAQ